MVLAALEAVHAIFEHRPAAPTIEAGGVDE
jgi:hypothetical protein